MDPIKKIILMIPVLIAAMILGNWFLAELKRSRIAGKPWYAAYCTLPGMLVIAVVILLPILVRALK